MMKSRFELIVKSYGRHKNLDEIKTKRRPITVPAITLPLLINDYQALNLKNSIFSHAVNATDQKLGKLVFKLIIHCMNSLKRTGVRGDVKLDRTNNNQFLRTALHTLSISLQKQFLRIEHLEPSELKGSKRTYRPMGATSLFGF